ncbi:SRPBCC family protein [Agromyces larvae]|uniref:SRPBCC family protein n=1 Tax=Agromyces larvae TaxID=2929802 RepID=A0ABY4C131_9MICO|nr:SRPBCC family protein [Agromyces larvae]UOE45188.1 SRPBCC family protein [Agromyces larvae]
MTAEFECSTAIAAPPDAVFDASLDIDLHVRSMGASRERAIAGVTSGRIGAGETVTWRARHFGVPFTMTSAITEYERPERFVDEQRRGPFASFRHEHRFESDASGTLMRDRIRFTAPLGPLGRMVEPLLRAYLRRLIEERNRHVRAAVEASDA